MAVLPFGLAPNDAVSVLEARGAHLAPSFAWQDVWQEEHGKAFTVAKSAQFDVLKDLYDGLVAALREGKSGKEFAAELKPVLQAKGWWGRSAQTDPLTGERKVVQLGSDRRLKFIYDVNMRVSYAAGAWARVERARKERPYLRYVAIMDMRTRPEHALRNNVCLRIDDPFWDRWTPPCGWKCRCTFENLSEADVKRLGSKLKFEAPKDTMRDWTNRRTGEIIKLPAGIDPGWGHNPAKAGWEGMMRAQQAEKIADAPDALRQAALERVVASDDFAAFVEQPAGAMPVISVPSAIATAAGRDFRSGILEASTLSTLQGREAPPTLSELRSLPSIAASASHVLLDGSQLIFAVPTAGGQFKVAVVKYRAGFPAGRLTDYRIATGTELVAIAARDGVRMLRGAF